jgi:uncharacterized membrane protein YuzA (DUF378 family)
MEFFENQNKNFKKIHLNTKLRMFLTLIVVIGAINWGTTAFGYNLVELLSTYLNHLFNTNYPINKGVYIIVGVCGILLALSRTTWLPFLGNTVFPDVLVPIKIPSQTDNKVTIKTEPNTKIAYWAALPNGDVPDVVTAYGDYSNNGVVMSDSNGIAELPILTGSAYTIPSGRKINRHVHYRELGKPYGMMGRVNTVYY